MSRLNGTTIVRDKSGRAHVLGPDDEVPEWAESAITNPNLWAEAPEGVAVPESAAEAEESEAEGGVSGTESGDALPVPPKVGKGSDTASWRAYALAAVAVKGLNIDIPEDAKRGDIVEALESAGIPTKE